LAETVRRTKIAESLAESIRDAILGGRYRPGDPLPSERDLAEKYEVNRSTIREAIQRLESWGLVEVRHGGGTLVRDFLVHAGIQLLPYLLAPAGQVDPRMLRDLLEMRVALLGWTARTAAERATAADQDALRGTLERLETASMPKALQELDFLFFEQLVAASQNRVLALLANAMREAYLANRDLFAPLYAAGFDTREHRRVVDAIAQRDGDAAFAAMTAYGERPLVLFGGSDV
jgi:GntR family transcriptional repressor for pyruvate dehydrogenase complex